MLRTHGQDWRDDSKIDIELDMLEKQLDLLEGASPVRMSRHSRLLENPVDHVSLIDRLVSRTEDPFRRPASSMAERPASIPRSSIEAFLRAHGSGGLILPILDSRGESSHSSFEKAELRRERDHERESRISSESHCKNLRSALSSVSEQMLKLAKLTTSERKELDYEFDRMKETISDLERERQELILKAERRTTREQAEHAHGTETQQMLEASERQCSDLLTELSSLRKQVEDRNRDLDILKASVADLEKRRHVLSSENASFSESNKRLREEVESLRERLAGLECRASVETLTIRPGSIRKQPEETPLPKSPLPTRVDTLYSPTAAVKPVPFSDLNFPSPTSPIVVNRRRKIPPPFADHIGIEPQSPKTIDPQHSVPILPETELPAFGADKRPVSPNPPWSLHETARDPSPKHTQRANEATTLRAPSPNHPQRAKEETVVPSPEEIAGVEAELLKLNLERTELESWLGRFPANYAGRTLAERKEKYMKEQRVAEITKVISDLRMLVKSWRQARSYPVG